MDPLSRAEIEISLVEATAARRGKQDILHAITTLFVRFSVLFANSVINKGTLGRPPIACDWLLHYSDEGSCGMAGRGVYIYAVNISTC